MADANVNRVLATPDTGAYPHPGKMSEVKLRRGRLSHFLEYQRQYFPSSGTLTLSLNTIYQKNNELHIWHTKCFQKGGAGNQFLNSGPV
ncbi:MAG: hypothetical protein WA635_08205 [Gallionella sp.]